MMTPQLYGNSAKYITGAYTIPGGGSKTAPANWLAGLTAIFTDGAINSNLRLRGVAYYSGANLDVTTRSLVVGSIFVGIKGHQRLAFPQNGDWSITKSAT